MTTLCYIGADPGKSGGIARIMMENDRLVHVSAIKMPETALDLWTVIDSLSAEGVVFACIEKVHSSPQMGVRSAFSFGESFGRLTMCFACSGIPFELVRPQKWQGAMGCLSKGDKNVTKERAQSLFPNVKVTHATADALLLAEYARRNFPIDVGALLHAEEFGQDQLIDDVM